MAHDGPPPRPGATLNRIDAQRPDAPALAAYGPAPVGVRTVEMVNPGQIDVLALYDMARAPARWPRRDRTLTVEVWYPARAGAAGERRLRSHLRDGRTLIDLHGRATRDAAPDGAAHPLVIVSHGYPGNRYLMAHLSENLASKGYVVAAIDHAESTYADQAAFGSTLVHRPLDQLFVLERLAQLSAAPGGWLSGLVDADRAGLIGYSMGGYGAVVAAGGGVTPAAVGHEWGAPHGALALHAAGAAAHEARADPRLKTAIAFAPWGYARGLWDEATLAGVRIPMLFVTGSADEVSGYEPGVRSIWRGARGVDRALLTYEMAGHNAGAPFPPPVEGRAIDPDLGFAPFDHYADPVWDTVRMNNIAQHFATAWLGWNLRGEAEAAAYLDLPPRAADLAEGPEDGAWRGFAPRTARGLRFERLGPGA